jgi:hypothetical protein
MSRYPGRNNIETARRLAMAITPPHIVDIDDIINFYNLTITNRKTPKSRNHARRMLQHALSGIEHKYCCEFGIIRGLEAELQQDMEPES